MLQGAGDSFIGALAYLIAEFPNVSLENHIGIACKIAAVSVTKPGTQTSFPTNDVLQEIMKPMWLWIWNIKQSFMKHL